jgi:hypothetical protein
MTKKKEIATPTLQINYADPENAITSTFIKSDNRYIGWALIIPGKKSYCIEKNARVILLFEDDQSLDFNSNTDFNCKNRILVVLGQGANIGLLDPMLNKRIAAIRIYTEDKIFECDLSSKEGLQLKTDLNCIFEKDI